VQVGIKKRSGDEDLGVAGPAKAFSALGTVGGYVEKVAPKAPQDVALELVEVL
jgi:hypothetical protein